MNKILEVFDDIIPLPLQNYIEYLLTQNSGFNWKLNNNLSGVKNSSDEIGFASPLRNLEHNSYENGNNIFKHYDSLISPLYFFTNYYNLIVKEVLVARSFLQLPSTKSTPQAPHTDLSIPHFIFLYYVNDSDGDTIFYGEDGATEIQRVSPKKGRIAFFDGAIIHAGSSPSKTKRAIINISLNYGSLENLK